MKEDLESRLKELPLAKPSARLRQRIFAAAFETQTPAQPPRRRVSIFRARIPLGWAAVAAVLMGAGGFLAARQIAVPPRPPAPRGHSTVEVRIVEVPAGQRHFFDFTGRWDDPVPPDSKVRIETGGNI